MVTFEFPRGRGLRRPPVGRRRAVRAAPHPRCLGGRCSGAPRYGCEPGRDGARWSLSPARNNLEPLLKAARCQNVLLFNLQFQYDASMEVQDLGSIRVLWGCLVGMTVVTLFRLTSVEMWCLPLFPWLFHCSYGLKFPSHIEGPLLTPKDGDAECGVRDTHTTLHNGGSLLTVSSGVKSSQVTT